MHGRRKEMKRESQFWRRSDCEVMSVKFCEQWKENKKILSFNIVFNCCHSWRKKSYTGDSLSRFFIGLSHRTFGVLSLSSAACSVIFSAHFWQAQSRYAHFAGLWRTGWVHRPASTSSFQVVGLIEQRYSSIAVCTLDSEFLIRLVVLVSYIASSYW